MLGLVAALAAGVTVPLLVMSRWAERDLHAFPFKNEDWLRYLLPSRFEGVVHPRIMLAGASTLRENVRVERFEAAFPGYDVYQGGISSGTLPDVTAALEYVEKVHGDEALPEFIVLGVSLRIIANLPADRPFALGLNLYSPHYAAIQLPQRVDLRPKGVLEGLSGQVRFLVNKQPERFRTALLAVLAHALSPDETTHRESAAARRIDEMLRNPIVAKIVRTMGLSVVLTHGVAGALQFAISPYKYSLWPAIPTETYQFLVGDNYDAKGDYAWSPIYSWDARKGDVDSRARLRHFIEFVKQRGIPTLIVNMPERDVSRGRYDRISYQVYRELLRDELARAGIEFVDMWEFLDTPEFYDREHTTERGSTRLTDEIIRIARQTILQQSSGKASAAAR